MVFFHLAVHPELVLHQHPVYYIQVDAVITKILESNRYTLVRQNVLFGRPVYAPSVTIWHCSISRTFVDVCAISHAHWYHGQLVTMVCG